MIKLLIAHGDKRVEMESTNTSDQHVVMALEGVFGIFGFEHERSPRQEIKFSSEAKMENPTKAVETLKEKQSREVAAAKSEIASKLSSAEPPLSRPRAVELLGSDRSLQVTIGEVVTLPDPPEWYETGIKVKEGVPHFRTRYWCQNPKCRHQGNQYVPLEADTTECHECKTVMILRPATGIVGDDGIPERDRFGNFFRADTLAGS
ncbi:hypothetical protein MKX64_24035 [Paenibacillus sp. FSL M8-0334]|uniref:hypothetical protein n=1 Tax=Paenibacillus sp. FSL M8-0334 TaxID=2921623 RepID=UPI0030FB7B7C